MVTLLQVSVAVAEPFAAGLVSAPHSTVSLAGQVIVGAVLSLTEIVCVQLEELPQESVAVQVRAIVWKTLSTEQLAPGVTTSL